MLITLVYCVVPVIALFWGCRKYNERKWGTCTNRISLEGKVAVITGCNSGIGYEIAREFIMRRAIVIFACRDMQATKNAIAKIAADTDCKHSPVPMHLDLASIASIRQFCETLKMTYNHLDILVNNAGVAYRNGTSTITTTDGVDVHFGVNHLGHFLLTNSLMDLLQQGRNPRIIIVASKMYETGHIDLDALMDENHPPSGYATSKLANVYFGHQLAKRMQSPTVYTVCPGWVYTNLFRHYNVKWYEWLALLPIACLYMRTARQGAQTAIYCATEPQLQNESGHIYRDCKRHKSTITLDDQVSQRLWTFSENVLRNFDH